MQNMILITTRLNAGKLSTNSFSLIPVSKDCPYTICNYYPANNNAPAVLHILSTIKKIENTMVPKLDDNGDYVKIKNPSSPDKIFKQERRNSEEFVEYQIFNPEEIEDFILKFAMNYNQFNYKQYL